MKLKYYLRGAGVGIIVSVLITLIALAFNPRQTESLSNEQIEQRAYDMGMVYPTQTDDELEVDNADSTDTTDATDAVSSINNVEDELVEVDNVVEDDDTSNGDKSVTYIPFSVSGGQSSNSVAENLKKAGLIEDAEDFNQYMTRLGVDELIQAGTFYICSDSDYEDIVALLVTKQDKRDTSPPEQPTE